MARKPTVRQEQQPRSHVRTRAFADGSGPTTLSEDGRSFDVVIYTETPVRTYILDPRTDVYIEADEVLLASGLDLSMSPRMPLVNNHNSHGDIRNVNLGRIDDVRSEGQQVVGRATLAHLHKDLAPDIAEGNLGNISATFYATDYEITDRAGDVPLAVAHKVYLLDGSLVPVGADPNASVRGTDLRTFPAPRMRSAAPTQETDMDDLEQLVVAAEEAVEAMEEAIEAAGEAADSELVERARKLREVAKDDETEEERRKREAAEKEEEERAKREGNLTDEEKKVEDEEIRSIRSIAGPYGLTKLVDDMKALRSRSTEIRKAVRSAIAERGAAPAASATQLKPQRPQRSAPVLDSRSIYAAINKRGA